MRASRPPVAPTGLDEREEQALGDSVRHMLEAARMIRPGSQSLFGYQLIVVFNQRFQESLSGSEQRLHLAAMALVAVATGLVMAPAAYHRRAEPDSVSRRFVRLSTRLLSWSTYPLMVGICVDFYLVATLIVANDRLGLGLAAALFLVPALLWVALPRVRAIQDALAR